MHSVPDDLLPPYAYVPGRHPHPTGDPRGHSWAGVPLPVEPLDPENPGQSREFRRGILLFNHGYYWEAHEAWERLWHAAGRTGPLATLVKGLIKLAAAGVKAREGNADGVRRHARRAAQLLRTAADQADDVHRLFEALGGPLLISRCNQLTERPLVDDTPAIGGLPVLRIEIHLPT